MFYCCGITDIGVGRVKNEDAFLIDRLVISENLLPRKGRAANGATSGISGGNAIETEISRPFIAAVADGVGGEASGEIASRLALEFLSEEDMSKVQSWEEKTLSIHERVKKYGIKKNRANMQTTLCAAAFYDGSVFIINVGDSRLYRYRSGEAKQLSKDQSLVQALYEQGSITKIQQMRHAARNVIFPALGNLSDDPSVDVTPVEGGALHGDLFLLCTDGLSEYITAGDLEETLGLPQKLPKRLAALIEIAKKNGSRDNITVVGISKIDLNE